ncbi:hypothetical protein BH23GEM9_BH23GEM9_14400 [soil metagenome]
MITRHSFWRAMLAVPLMLCLPHLARAQEAAGHPVVRNLEEIEFVAVPGLPTCAPGAVQRGDPSQGPSVILARMETGCTIPWHWHTPNEHLMMVRGEAVMEMRDGQQLSLRPGGFALMPSGHVHQARCIQECTMFVYSDSALDIRYVDAQGTEISAEAALAALRETNPRSR